MPVLIDRVRHLHQPASIIDELQQFPRRKKLDPIRRWISQWLKQPRSNQNRNIMRLTVEHPGSLFGCETSGKLSEERQKAMLIIFHTRNKFVNTEPSLRQASVPHRAKELVRAGRRNCRRRV